MEAQVSAWITGWVINGWLFILCRRRSQ